MPQPSWLVSQPSGEEALAVEIVDDDAERAWRRAHGLAAAVRESGFPGLRSVVPTYRSVLVEFDARAVDPAQVAAVVSLCAADADRLAPTHGTLIEVPVVYGGDEGPDLDAVAAMAGLSAADLIAEHTRREHTIRCFGPAASIMVDGPAIGVSIPRLASPRVSVPAGSVALAGRQGMVWGGSSPTGWHVIGRAPLRLVDVERAPVVAYRPGDRVRFVSIDPADASSWTDAVLGES